MVVVWGVLPYVYINLLYFINISCVFDGSSHKTLLERLLQHLESLIVKYNISFFVSKKYLTCSQVKFGSRFFTNHYI